MTIYLSSMQTGNLQSKWLTKSSQHLITMPVWTHATAYCEKAAPIYGTKLILTVHSRFVTTTCDMIWGGIKISILLEPAWFYELIIEVSWKFSWLSFHLWLSKELTILHMSWQLSCHDMCKIVTWCDCYFTCKNNIWILWVHKTFAKYAPDMDWIDT